MSNSMRTSAEIQAEVDLQRRQLENRVTEIQQRLSPGQLLDEALGYMRSNGGAELVGNFGNSLRANPLPIALTGIGLAWLMTTGMRPPVQPAADFAETDEARSSGLGFAKISGAIRRVGETTDTAGQRYTEFTDEAGARFKATSDELGRRTGHFIDAAGASYRGFTDSAGNRIRDFMDEAGSRLDDAQGWAADSWDAAQEKAANLRSTVAGAAGGLRSQAGQASGQVQQGATAMGSMINGLIHEQPLIGAALAFAAGAAIAATLPRTPQEDAVLGETADNIKAEGARAAGKAYQEGKRQLADAYSDAREKVAETYDHVRDDIGVPGSTMTH